MVGQTRDTNVGEDFSIDGWRHKDIASWRGRRLQPEVSDRHPI